MAIQVYGPFFVPINSIQQTNVNSQCGGIMVFNRSLYNDMFVSLSTDQPTTVPAVGMGSVGSTNYAGSDITHWHIYIPPGHVASLPIPNAKSYGILNPYSIGPNSNGTGTIYYAAVPYYQTNVAPPPGVSADVLAPTGYSDFGYSQVTFLTWGINDLPPSIAGAPLTAEMTGQPRVIALPPAPAFKVVNTATPTPINTYVNVNSFPSIGNYPFTLTNSGAGLNGFMNVTVYSFAMSVNFSAVTFQNQQMWARMVVLDSGSNVVSSLAFADGSPSFDTLFFAGFFQTAGTTLATISYPAPVPVGLAIAAGTGPPYSVGVQVKQTANTGGPFQVLVSATYDISGFFPPTAGSLDGPGGTLSPPLAYQEYIGFSH